MHTGEATFVKFGADQCGYFEALFNRYLMIADHAPVIHRKKKGNPSMHQVLSFYWFNRIHSCSSFLPIGCRVIKRWIRKKETEVASGFHLQMQVYYLTWSFNVVPPSTSYTPLIYKVTTNMQSVFWMRCALAMTLELNDCCCMSKSKSNPHSFPFIVHVGGWMKVLVSLKYAKVCAVVYQE